MDEEEKRIIDIDSSSESSLDRTDRSEMVWNKQNQDLLRQFGENANKISKIHSKKMKRWKKIYIGLGIPQIFLSVLAAFLQPYLSQDYEIILVAMMLSSGLLSGVNSFINPSLKQEKHDAASHKYNVISRNINTILHIPKKDRQAADVIVNEFRLKLNHLDEVSPSI